MNKDKNKFAKGDIVVDKEWEKIVGELVIGLVEQPRYCTEFYSVKFDGYTIDIVCNNLRLATDNETKTYKIKKMFKK